MLRHRQLRSTAPLLIRLLWHPLLLLLLLLLSVHKHCSCFCRMWLLLLLLLLNLLPWLWLRQQRLHLRCLHQLLLLRLRWPNALLGRRHTRQQQPLWLVVLGCWGRCSRCA